MGITHDCGRRPLGFHSRSSSSSVMVMAAAGALAGCVGGAGAVRRLCMCRCVEVGASRVELRDGWWVVGCRSSKQQATGRAGKQPWIWGIGELS